MMKHALLVCLAAFAATVQAQQIPFYDTQFNVTVVAVGDGLPGFDSQSTASGDLVSASTDSTGMLAIATAGAVAGPGLLATSADVSAVSGIASSVATAHFAGSFVNVGPVALSIDFLTFESAVDSGSAAASLFVSLVSNGVTMFQDYISGPWELQYLSAGGHVSVLELTLTSEAGAGFLTAGAGGASSVGLVTFTATAVPEPSALLLMLGGLAVFRARQLAQQRRTAA